MGMNGAATYMQQGNMSYNAFDQLTQGSNMSDISSIMNMQQGNQLGAFGTSESYNYNNSNNNMTGLMGGQMNTGYNPYGSQMTNTGYSPYGSQMNTGYAQPSYYTNPALAGQNTRMGNTGWGSIMQSGSLLPTESKILFDMYPASPIMTTGLGTNQYGMNAYGMNGMNSAAYGMGSPYATGQYGAMMQNSMLPTYNQIQFRNNCNDTLQLEVRAMPQIYVSPNTLTIAPKQTSQVNVMSSSLPGTYTMNILVGTGTNDLLPLMSLPINVIDYASNTVGDNCFKLSEEPTINMSSAYKRNKILKVYNYCYSKGVIFDEAQPVELYNLYTLKDISSNVKNSKECTSKVEEESKAECKDEKEDKAACLAKARKNNKAFCDDGIKIGGNEPYVVATPVGLAQVEYSGTYGQYQSIDVILEKTPAIQRLIVQQMGKGSSLGDTVSKISSLRTALTDLYSNVEFPALFAINARIGYGMTGIQKTVNKMVTVRDMWNVLAAADIYEGLNGANKNCTPENWDGNVSIGESYTLKESAFVGGKARVPFEGGFELLFKTCFGTMDDVKFLDSPTYNGKDTKGNEFNIKFTPNYSKFQISFDLIMNGCIDGKTQVDQEFGYIIHSVIFPEASADKAEQKFTLKLTLDFKKRTCFENGQIVTGEGSGMTGPDVEPTGQGTGANVAGTEWCKANYGDGWDTLSNYGFGKLDITTLTDSTKLNTMLKFNYSVEPGSSIAPDCTKMFCDAEQLKWFLTGKFKEINVTPQTVKIVAPDKNPFKDKEFVVKSDNNLLELEPIKVLDPVSLYFLERDVKKYKEDPKVKKDEFVATFKNMPNIFFKKQLSQSGTCDGSRNVDFNYTVDAKTKYCYFNAFEMTKMNEDMLNSLIKVVLNPNEFEVVILSTEKDSYYLFDSKIFGQNKITYAYLRPDNYKAGMESRPYGNYVIENVKDDTVNITGPKVVLVVSQIMTPSDPKNKVDILPANYYFSKEAQDILEKNFLYNLPIDPAVRDDKTYKGEYGLCVANSAMTKDKGLLNWPIGESDCSSTAFAQINGSKITVSDNSLFFTNINAAGRKAGFDLRVPDCKSGVTDCKITTDVTKKTISYKKEDYYLSNIFNTPENYCYRQTIDLLEIKYKGPGN
jgi:hypothetical protein